VATSTSHGWEFAQDGVRAATSKMAFSFSFSTGVGKNARIERRAFIDSKTVIRKASFIIAFFRLFYHTFQTHFML